MSAAAYEMSVPSGSRLGPHRKHRKQDPCPVCGGTDSFCLTFADGGTICGRTPNDHPAGIGYMHWPNGRPDDWRERLAAMPTPPPRQQADIVLVDRAYRAILSCCPLSDDDRTGLYARGMTDAEIDGNFGTLPDDERTRRRIVAAVTEAIGCDPAGVVPGFIHKHGRTQLVPMSGLLVAGWTADGLLGSLQVRVDNPGDGGKYRHLSAGDGPGSIGADGHFVSVSRPQRPVSMHTVIVTEGPIKGRIIATRLGRITLSVAGVHNTGKLVATLQELGDVKEVLLGFDEDRTTNEHVAAANTKTTRKLVAAGYAVKQLDWPAEYGKGLDDALVAGVIPVALPWSTPEPPAGPSTPPDSASDVAEELEQLRRLHERGTQAVAINQARARIQRNTKLPARPMAATVLGVLAQAATASNPAGGYRVPAGFVLAPVGTLAFDAGTKTGNAGTQLKKLEEAGLIARHTVPDTLSPGTADPETGAAFSTPRRIERHFIAVAGHEHEPITPAIWSELVERMAAYDSGAPERRGGFRIPRCPHHPHAKVERHWTAHCTECDRQLYPEPGEIAVDEIPAMLLEPISAVDQTLVDRAEPDTDDDMPLTLTTPHGIRPIAYKVHDTAEPAAVHQSLMDRETHAVTPEEARRARAYADLAAWQEQHTALPEPADVPLAQLFDYVALEDEEAGADRWTM